MSDNHGVTLEMEPAHPIWCNRTVRALLSALAAGLAITVPAGAAQAPLQERLGAFEVALTRALGQLHGSTLPAGFAPTVAGLDAQALTLGAALPTFGSGPARGSVVFQRLRSADTNLALARRDGPARLNGAASDLSIVSQELSRDPSLRAAAARFGSLEERVRGARDATDHELWQLMLEKERLLSGLPSVGGVPFHSFYQWITVLHGQVGHAFRTTRRDEPALVRRDLLRALRTIRALEAATR
jgi:hypothetical protein